MSLQKCSLCENMEDPRFRAEANGRVYPLCDGCGGPETSLEAVALFGKLAALPLPPVPGPLDPLSTSRIHVLAARAGGHAVGAPATRDEERRMALEIIQRRELAESPAPMPGLAEIDEDLRSFVRGCASSYDCDGGPNGQHPSYCRKCTAEALAAQFTSPAPKEKP